MKKNVVLGLSASIAIYKAGDIVRRLQDAGCNVFVVMTEEASRLMNPLVFASLSGNPVYTDMFDAPQEWEIEHVGLAKKANIVLIAPATANIIGKIAGGICDDLLTCTVCATKAPVLLAPAMNEGMWRNKIVQENIHKLKKSGYKFIEPRVGKLACGDVGKGCLAEVETIVREVKKVL